MDAARTGKFAVRLARKPSLQNAEISLGNKHLG